jgi:hypothetical protein
MQMVSVLNFDIVVTVVDARQRSQVVGMVKTPCVLRRRKARRR